MNEVIESAVYEEACKRLDATELVILAKRDWDKIPVEHAPFMFIRVGNPHKLHG